MISPELMEEIRIKKAELLLAGWTCRWSHSGERMMWTMPSGHDMLWDRPLASIRKAHYSYRTFNFN